MAELQDPDKPAGFVVSVDEETGVAMCNDGRLLQPAGKNPWYVLMTIAGSREIVTITKQLLRTGGIGMAGLAPECRVLLVRCWPSG